MAAAALQADRASRYRPRIKSQTSRSHDSLSHEGGCTRGGDARTSGGGGGGSSPSVQSGAETVVVVEVGVEAATWVAVLEVAGSVFLPIDAAREENPSDMLALEASSSRHNHQGLLRWSKEEEEEGGDVVDDDVTILAGWLG